MPADEPHQVKRSGSVRRVGRVGDLRRDDQDVGSGVHDVVLAMGDAATGLDPGVIVGPAAGILPHQIRSRRKTGRQCPFGYQP